jgi:hypothetical protein
VSQLQTNGERLAYTLPQLKGLTVCDIPALQCTQHALDIDDDSRYDWTLGTEHVWYRAAKPSGGHQLVKASLRSGEREAFAYAPTAMGTNLAVSGDGKRLLVARETAPAIDLHWLQKAD